MKRIHFHGRKNHGKRTLVVELVEHLTARGLRVGTIKHTHHLHELDALGKDSHRHREVGTSVVDIQSRGQSGVPWKPGEATESEARYEQFAPQFAGCDPAIVEGDTQASVRKVEIWRKSAGSTLMAAEDSTIAAVISDDSVNVAAPVWPRRDLPQIAANILQLLEMPTP